MNINRFEQRNKSQYLFWELSIGKVLSQEIPFQIYIVASILVYSQVNFIAEYWYINILDQVILWHTLMSSFWWTNFYVQKRPVSLTLTFAWRLSQTQHSNEYYKMITLWYLGNISML